MDKIINTLKYGSKTVKKDLILTIFSGVAAVALGVCSLVFSQLFLFFLAIVFVFVTITMAQTFGIHSMDSPVVSPKQTDANIGDEKEISATPEILGDTKEVLNERTIEAESDNSSYDAEESVDASENENVKNKKEKKNDKKIKKVKNKKDKSKKDKIKKGKSSEIVEEENAESLSESEDKVDIYDEDIDAILEREDKKQKAKKEGKENEQEDNEEVEDDEVSEESETETDDSNVQQLNEETVKTYNKKKYKKIMHKYKVKRDHRRVIVDRCEALSISQTPAFIWVADKQLNLLLIEQEPRHLMFPIYGIRQVKYHKKQLASPDIDYPIFKSQNFISNMFGGLLPDYLHSTVVGDTTAYKNLYSIGPDICFTNRSAINLFDLLGVEFAMEDKVTTSNKVNIYFKDAYKANVMLRDNVFDANGYADRISTILGDMARSTISYNEFKETLNLMIKNKLITQEFATHYMEVRDNYSK